MMRRARRSMSCMPCRVFTPMYIRIPYSTGIGMCLGGLARALLRGAYLRRGASWVERPTRRNTRIPVTLWGIGSDIGS